MKFQSLFALAAITVFAFSSCKDEAPIDNTPKFEGSWELEKLNVKVFFTNQQFYDTTIATSSTLKYSGTFDGTNFTTTSVDGTDVTNDKGTYILSNGKLEMTFEDGTKESYEDVVFNATSLTMVQYDPSKTDPNRQVYTFQFKRK